MFLSVNALLCLCVVVCVWVGVRGWLDTYVQENKNMSEYQAVPLEKK